MFRNLAAWLRLEDYDARKAASADRVVRRFARGNVALQNGKFITEAELSRRSQAAVVSMEKIELELSRL
jgi:hypothetical protein